MALGGDQCPSLVGRAGACVPFCPPTPEAQPELCPCSLSPSWEWVVVAAGPRDCWGTPFSFLPHRLETLGTGGKTHYPLNIDVTCPSDF